jgi:hypothetical protein
MKNRTMLMIVVLLPSLVLVSCVLNEMAWLNKEKSPDPLREVLGLPSIAVGNLNPAARNPGLELFCTGLYDTPGGYCNYFTDGVPFLSFRSSGNVTLEENGK